VASFLPDPAVHGQENWDQYVLAADQALDTALVSHVQEGTTAHGGMVSPTDSRLTDQRFPLPHASTHAPGSTDPLTPATLGAEATIHKGASGGYAGLDSNGHVPPAQLGSGNATAVSLLRGDNTWFGTGGATSSTFLRGDGVWSVPPSAQGSGQNGFAWMVNVKNYGAVGDGATDDSAAFIAARNAVFASRGAGYTTAAPMLPVLLIPPGNYRITQPDALVAIGSPLIEGMSWVGFGKRISAITFDPPGDYSASLTAGNLMTLKDTDNSGGRAKGWRFSGLTFKSTNATATFMYSFSTAAAPNQDIGFTDVEWAGPWLRGVALDGDSTANLNSEMFFDHCHVANSASFAVAFFHAGITSPSTNTQQDQFLNYWFTNCKFEYASGDLIRLDRGGSVTVTGGSWIGAAGGTGRFLYMPFNSGHFDGNLRVLVQGLRAELRQETWKFIDCAWDKGNIVFKNIMDSANSFRSFAPTHTAHQYDFSNSNRGPMVSYEDCELQGLHSVKTTSSVPTLGRIDYLRCRFNNKSTATTALTWTGTAAPHYSFKSCWSIADATN
jgi:hypothetical protein